MNKLLALPVCLILALAGCGEANDDPSDAASGPEGSAETVAPEEGGGSGAGGSEAAGGEAVTIKDFEFDPEELTVPAGTEVEWTNQDSADHNVIFEGGEAKDIENLEQGQSGTVKFTKAGDYAYVCSYHPGMEASVTVE